MSTVTVSSLKTEIQNIVQDDSFDSYLLGWMNECVNSLAEELMLMDLFSSDTVSTDTSTEYVSLPSDFHKMLKRVRSSDQERDVNICSFEELLDEYSSLDNDGDVYYVAVKGDYLYYQPIPTTADTLTLYYYRVPTEMSADTDTPDGIPCFYKSPVIVPYVCWRCFEMLEDGIEGAKVNSAYFKQKFEENKSKLISRNSMYDTLKKRSFSA